MDFEMTDDRDPLPAINGESLIQSIERYWRELGGHHGLPHRSDVDPARIDAALPWSFILERVATGHARLRVSGQQLNDLAQMDTRGMPLSVFFTPEARPTLERLIAHCFDLPAIVDVPVLSPRSLTRHKLTGRMILLPLANRPGAPERALGALFADGARGRSARHFGIPEDETHRIVPVTQPRTLLRALSGGARSQQIAGPAPRPALRLIVNNG